MKLLKILPLLLVPILFYQCQKEISSVGHSEPVTTTPDPISARLQGNVYDENDQPAAGVIVTVGSQTTTTDAKGNFRFDMAALDKKASLVKADKNGYFKAYRVFAATSGTNYVSIKLVKRTLVGTIDATSGGSVTLSNGAKISLPANGVMKASNSAAYTGTVNVYAAYIDPTADDISRTIPGSFMADDVTGKRVILSSYGMLAVELQSTAAEKLQIKTGSVATLSAPIPPSLQSSAPATIALWSVDEQTGIWKEEGTATKNGNEYVGDVKHFTFWNYDIGINSIQLTLTVKTTNNQPIVHALIRLKRASGNTSPTYGMTDSLGQVSGLVPSNENLILEVLSSCGNSTYGSVYTQNIGPFTQATNLNVLNVAIVANGVVTLSGHVSNCSGANVTNGYAIVYYNNVVRYAVVDAGGNFNVTFLVCSSAPTTAQVLVIDDGAQQQSNMTTVNIATPSTNVGTITACGTSSSQYINYTMDGTPYSFTANPADSIYHWWSSYSTGTSPYNTGCNFNPIPGTYAYLRFTHTTPSPGTYPVSWFMVSPFGYNSGTILSPFNAVVTSYPQAVGQYCEGTFSGQFKDSVNVTHTITNGSFRVRKTY